MLKENLRNSTMNPSNTQRNEFNKIKLQNDNKRKQIFDKAMKIRTSDVESIKHKLDDKEKKRENLFKKTAKENHEKFVSKSVQRQNKLENWQNEHQK